MHSEAVFILLFIVATTVAISVQRLFIPYTVALVIAGIALGLIHAFKAPTLTKDLLYSFFLPGLLFEAAFYIEFNQFRRNRIAISSLAVPGVIIATALVALTLPPVINAFHFFTEFNWKHALAFGALISATDPVAVVAMFRSLGVPQRLAVLLDGESLLNDGTAIVIFTLSLTLVTGSHVTAGGLVLNFIEIVGLGALIGMGVGMAVSQVIKKVDDPMIEITLTTIAAYGSFLVAEHFHYSGVIATVTAGLLCGNYAVRVGMSPSTRIAVETFWEYLSFSLNSVVFLLIGFEINLRSLLDYWQAILIAYIVVIGSRGLVISGVSFLLRKSREKIPWKWSAVMTWGGLRGALPMVLALSIPQNFQNRDFYISLTFGVVIISILLHGLSMSPFLKWIGIVKGEKEMQEYEFTKGKLQAVHAALKEINNMSHVYFNDEKILDNLKNEYEQIAESSRKKISELHPKKESIYNEELIWVKKHLMLIEKTEVMDSFHHGVISQTVQEKLLAEIDARLLDLESEDGSEKKED